VNLLANDGSIRSSSPRVTSQRAWIGSRSLSPVSGGSSGSESIASWQATSKRISAWNFVSSGGATAIGGCSAPAASGNRPRASRGRSVEKDQREDRKRRLYDRGSVCITTKRGFLLTRGQCHKTPGLTAADRGLDLLGTRHPDGPRSRPAEDAHREQHERAGGTPTPAGPGYDDAHRGP
jgi:hypothetical protein